MVHNSLVQLITQSDAMTKGVLLILLIMSIVCWGLFFYKLVFSYMKRRQLAQALALIEKLQTFEELRSLALQLSGTLPGYILARNIGFIRTLMEGRASFQLTVNDKEFIAQAIEQTLEEIIHTEESYLPFFSGCAAVSPLLGLFGTVWGLVHSFVSIGEKQQADIATVAPGIAEALITTLAGLMVAIPSLVMFHYLSAQVKQLEHSLIALLDYISLVVNRSFFKS